MRIVTHIAAAVAANLRTLLVAIATLGAGIGIAGQALGQECRQTSAEVLASAAQGGKAIAATAHGNVARALVGQIHWTEPPPTDVDEAIVIDQVPGITVIAFLSGDCVVQVAAIRVPADAVARWIAGRQWDA